VARGLALSAELARSDANALVASLGAIFFSLTLTYGMWTRVWPDEAAQPYLRRITRFWMPLAYLAPYALYGGGLALPFMANLLLLGVITVAFAWIVRRRLGASRVAR
jgi:hypothetical protein